MEQVLPTIVAALLCLHTSSGALQIKMGDVYEWSRQDIGSLTEEPETVTVIDSGPSSKLPADSGMAWWLHNSAESDRLNSAQSDRSVSDESDRSIPAESDRFRPGQVRLTQSA